VCFGTELVFSQEFARAFNPHETVSSDGRAHPMLETSPSLKSVPSFRGTADKLAEGNHLAEYPQQIESATEVWSLLKREPGTSGYGRESVIGPDSRVRVSRTTTFPARAVAFITYTQPGVGNFRCTGWLINKNTVATAGHCVHSGGPGGSFVTNVRVYPGRNGSSSPFGSCTARRLYTVVGWTNSSDERYDYGAIKLNCNIGQTTGWFGFTWQASTLNGQTSIINGYPGDKPLAQWKSTDQVRVSQSQILFYRNDTFGGQSGAPVYNIRPGTSCSVCAITIHASGLHGLSPHSTHNHGPRITQTVFNNLIRWRNAL
jgi:glutamyl endopeptidase